MKRITLFLFIFGFFMSLQAQHTFPPIPGPTNVPNGAPTTLNINDAVNTAAAPASSSGGYESFVITADWVAGGGNPWSNEADVTVSTAAGDVFIDPPTTGGLGSNANTALTFEGDFNALYDPTVDGTLNITLNQSFGGSDANWSNITVTIFEAPTCPEPSGMAESNLAADAVDLNWTAGNVETLWNVEWNSGADFVPGTGAQEGLQSVNTTPTLGLTGLTPSTQYFVYYQADCGIDGPSLWVGPFTFTTFNVPPPAPVGVTCNTGSASTVFSAEFADIDGWTGDINTGNGSWSIPHPQTFDSGGTGPDAAFSGTTWMSYEASGNTDLTASTVSPAIDLTTAVDGAELTFQMHAFGADMGTLNVGIGTSPTGPFTTEFTWVGELQTAGDQPWVPVGINLDSYLGQVIYIEFNHTGTGTGFEGDMSIDLVQVSTCGSFCIAPSSVNLSNITDLSVDVDWVANNGETEWEIVVQPAGTGEPTGSGTSITTNPYTATGLTGTTDYEIYIRAVCSPGVFSVWSGPVNFTTQPQAPVGVTCGNGDASSNIFTAEFDAVEGWTGNINGGNGTWSIPFPETFDSGGTGPDAAFSGANWMSYEASGNASDLASAVSPGVDLTTATDGAELSFYMHAFGEDIGTLNVGVGTSPTGPFTTLFSWTGELQTAASDPWVPIGVNLDAYLGQVIYIEFSHAATGAGFEGDMSIDLVTVATCGDFCIAPSGITASNITTTGADISWTPNSAETSWEYVVQPAGTGIPTGSGTTVTAPNASVSGLQPSLDYEVYVLANCSSGNSIWAGPFIFTTAVQFNFTVDCAVGPVDVNYCYGNNNSAAETFTYTSSDGSPLNIFFNDGQLEDCCDELIVLDSDGVTQLYNDNPPSVAGLSFQSTGDTISWYIDSDFSVNCQGNGFTPFDVTVACATCINPQATYTVIDDCANGNQFLIDVNISDIGDATTLTINNNFDANTVDNITAPGTFQIGPFPFLVDIVVTVSNDQDVNCVINSAPIQLQACPPANDNPCGATVAGVNADESCTITTPGTLLEATPSGVPTGTCPGDPNDDVWFEFVALGDQTIIDIQNIAGGSFNIDHAVYEGACDNLTELYCSDDTFSLTPSLTVGNTYYIRIFSGGSAATSSTFDLCLSTLGTPTFCLDALPICADPSINYPSIVGDQIAPPYLDYDCLGSQPDPQWNTINFDVAGDYQFSLDQVSDTGTPLDIDFIVWGPFTDQAGGCVDLLPENIEDCSFSATASETININNVPANSVYVILITNFSQQPGSYTFIQDSGPPDGTNCDVVCDVVMNVEGAPVDDDVVDPATPDEVFNYCGFTSIQLEATTTYSVDQYIWYLDGFPIPGADQATYTATQSGTYQIQVLGGICDPAPLYLSALIDVNFYDDAPDVLPQTIEQCDNDGDGSELFDLDALTTSLGINTTDFVVTYHLNLSDANQALNPQSSPYSSSGETLVIRVEDVDSAADGFLGCREISDVQLIMLSAPTIGTPNNLEACSVNSNVDFSLTDNDSDVLGGLSAVDYTVTYHNSLADAEAGSGALASPYSGTNNETIYVRLEDNTTGCYSTTSFDLIVTSLPVVMPAASIEECDDNDGSVDSTADFDLDAFTTSLGLSAIYTVTYHPTQLDADAGTGALGAPLSSGSTTVYIRIENTDPSNTGTIVCYDTYALDLVVLATPVAGTPVDLEICSVNSSEPFGLTDNDSAVLNGLSSTDHAVTYHASLADAQNASGILSSPYTGSNGETIYVRLENTTTGCFVTTSFGLVINAPTQTATSQNIEECDDNDGTLDDIALFDLGAHTAIVLGTQDALNFNVTYHATQADADNNVSPLPSVYSTGSTTIYVRVEDVSEANCYVTTSFDLIVLDEVTASISTSEFYYDSNTGEFLLCPEADSGVVLTLVPNGFDLSQVSIQWFLDGVEIFGANGISYEAFEQGDYSADITLNSTGCTFTLFDITVTEIENCVIPQGISPGVSIGLNDTFDLRYFNVTQLEIFNRNGTKVYSKRNYTNEWVGQSDNGDMLPVGTYFYYMVYEGGTKTRSGWVYINK